jgi:Zn-dependent M28 family amino/carboxypeptidase
MCTSQIDLVSNASWSLSSTGVYFEGTNILVKIDGTSTAGGVLFSAHYESVATAPDSTDVCMGVATLLQLVHYFAKNRPLRTAVFNINNGEEDGMNASAMPFGRARSGKDHQDAPI